MCTPRRGLCRRRGLRGHGRVPAPRQGPGLARAGRGLGAARAGNGQTAASRAPPPRNGRPGTCAWTKYIGFAGADVFTWRDLSGPQVCAFRVHHSGKVPSDARCWGVQSSPRTQGRAPRSFCGHSQRRRPLSLHHAESLPVVVWGVPRSGGLEGTSFRDTQRHLLSTFVSEGHSWTPRQPNYKSCHHRPRVKPFLAECLLRSVGDAFAATEASPPSRPSSSCSRRRVHSASEFNYPNGMGRPPRRRHVVHHGVFREEGGCLGILGRRKVASTATARRPVGALVESVRPTTPTLTPWGSSGDDAARQRGDAPARRRDAGRAGLAGAPPGSSVTLRARGESRGRSFLLQPGDGVSRAPIEGAYRRHPHAQTLGRAPRPARTLP